MAIDKVICPNCGAENIQSPIITTCSSCMGSLEGAEKAAARPRLMEEVAAPPAPEPPEAAVPIEEVEEPPAPAAPEPPAPPAAVEEAVALPPPVPPEAPAPPAVVEEVEELPPPAPPEPPTPPVAVEEPEEIPPPEAPAVEEQPAEEPPPFDFRPRRSEDISPITTTEPIVVPPPPLVTEEPVRVEIEEGPPVRPLRPTERVVCPRCRAGNPPEYGFCAVCGERLPGPTEEVPVEAPERTRCPRCQQENPKGRFFCDGCGLDLRLELAEVEGKPWSPPAHATRPRLRPTQPGVSQTSGASKFGACCGCLVMGLIAFIFIFLSWLGRQ